MRLVPLLAVLLASAGCTDSGPDRVALPTPEAAFEVVTELEGWSGGTTELTAADLDGDGRVDLVLTSHLMNRVQPFLQRPKGRFVPLPPLQGVGFHPNGVTPYQDDRGRRFLLQNAETREELRIYRYKKKGPAFAGAVPAPSPLVTVALAEAGQPRSLLVLSRGAPSLTLYRGFDARSAEFSKRQTLWRPEPTKAGQILSPILARLTPAADSELIFVDTMVSGLRALRFAADGEPYIDDVYLAEPEFRPTLVAAGAGTPDGLQPLFLLGGKESPLRILWQVPEAGFEVRDVALPVDFNNDLAVIEDAGQPPLLVISRQEALMLLRFPDGLEARPEFSLIDKDPKAGQLILAAADFDGDGLTDLALANSGNRKIPPLVLRGPLWEHAAALSEYYTYAERFEPIVRSQDAGQVPGRTGASDVPRIPGIPGLVLPR